MEIKKIENLLKMKYKNVDVLITTYGTLRNDYNIYDDITFDFCIIDEGQNIKNPLSQSSEVVKAIKSKSEICINRYTNRK